MGVATTLLMWLPTCHPTPTPQVVASSALPGERDRTPQPSSFGCVRSTCICRSRLHPACAAHLRTRSLLSWRLSPSLRLHHVRCTKFTLAGSSRIRLPLRALSLSGTWLDSATDRGSWRCVLTCVSVRSSLSIRRSLNCVSLCKFASRWQGLQRASPSRHNLPPWTLCCRLAGVPTSCSKCPGSDPVEPTSRAGESSEDPRQDEQYFRAVVAPQPKPKEVKARARPKPLPARAADGAEAQEGGSPEHRHVRKQPRLGI